jgi:HEAT repeat protein
MKGLYLMSLLAVSPLFAQSTGSQQRTIETVVMDVLAQLPADSQAKQQQRMQDFLKEPQQIVEILGSMLTDPAKGQNAKVEYAISGLVSHVTAAGQDQALASVRAGLRNAIQKCPFNDGKAFLMSQLQWCSGPEDSDALTAYLQDKELASPAINALIQTPGTDNLIIKMLNEQKFDRNLLAYAVKEKALAEAETSLLAWLKDEADASTKAMICSALASCGSKASLDALAPISMVDYLNLLQKLSKAAPSDDIKQRARALLTDQPTQVRTAAMQAVINMEADIQPILQETLKDPDSEYRNAVLKMLSPRMTAEITTCLPALYPALTDAAKIDLVNWLGNTHAEDRMDIMETAVQKGKPALSQSALIAASKLKTERAAQLLVSQLSGPNRQVAAQAILASKTNLVDKLAALLDAPDKEVKQQVLSIVSQRRMKQVADKVFNLLDSPDAQLRQAAYNALNGVVSETDLNRLIEMLKKPDGTDLPKLQEAIKMAMLAMSPDKKLQTISDWMANAPRPEIYYSLLASAGTDAAATRLIEEYNSGKSADKALAELLKMSNPPVLKFLWTLIAQDKATEPVIARFIALSQSSKGNLKERCGQYGKLLQSNISTAIKKSLVSALSTVPTGDAFTLAAKYLDDPDSAYEAANTVKSIASNKSVPIDNKELLPALNKAIAILKETGNADDGYAVDAIKKLLTELKPVEPFVLSDDEKKQGFELLFDGTDLSKWQDNATGYKVANGAIHVVEDYGHNLYTRKEYQDFVMRFSFCFARPGVNNGIGVRTPVGVDAAYDGMCELQIIDNDAPEYAHLADYQYHGSVYGIIPARRIKLKPIGQWNEEEIKVVGDHITVTVNGEVILDANVREACQGHNVSPKAGEKNPYTMDKRDHPGMFNKKGFISYCGHGAGFMLKNIRVLDLSAQAAQK